MPELTTQQLNELLADQARVNFLENKLRYLRDNESDVIQLSIDIHEESSTARDAVDAAIREHAPRYTAPYLSSAQIDQRIGELKGVLRRTQGEVLSLECAISEFLAEKNRRPAPATPLEALDPQG